MSTFQIIETCRENLSPEGASLWSALLECHGVLVEGVGTSQGLPCTFQVVVEKIDHESIVCTFDMNVEVLHLKEDGFILGDIVSLEAQRTVFGHLDHILGDRRVHVSICRPLCRFLTRLEIKAGVA